MHRGCRALLLFAGAPAATSYYAQVVAAMSSRWKSIGRMVASCRVRARFQHCAGPHHASTPKSSVMVGREMRLITISHTPSAGVRNIPLLRTLGCHTLVWTVPPPTHCPCLNCTDVASPAAEGRASNVSCVRCLHARLPLRTHPQPAYASSLHAPPCGVQACVHLAVLLCVLSVASDDVLPVSHTDVTLPWRPCLTR